MLRIESRVLRAFAACVWLCACSSGGVAPDSANDDEVEQADESSRADEEGADDEPSSVAKDAGKASAEGDKNTKKDAGQQPARDAGKAAPSASAPGLPCAIASIVSAHCAECHGNEPAFGADFSLTSLADFQESSSDPQKKRYEVAHERVGLMGAKRMPPASKKAIATSELERLKSWLAAGAKADGESCEVTAASAPAGDAGTMFETPGSGGAHIKPIDYQDPELKCYPFVAYGKGDRQGKYAVPTRPDFYVAFMMKAPWTGTQYVRSFRGLIDNKDVIHHWLFFKNLTPQQDGRITEDALGAHPDGEMLYGWAPGGDDMYLDPDVGIAVNGSDTFLLEAHYNNKQGSPSPDASGVEICVTPKKPEHISALTWIGTDIIAGTTATGQCNSTHSTPVRIFSAQPHMHVSGKHMKVVVNRKGGMKETIHDEDFDFEYQRSYNLDVTLQPGDSLTTTCTYSAPATFGKGTTDEMCYFFANSWPAGALTMPGIGTIVHGPNSCL